MTRLQASRLTFDELDAAEVCDCGRALDAHPPLATPGPLRSWMAERHERRDLAPEMAGRIRAGGRSWSLTSDAVRRAVEAA